MVQDRMTFFFSPLISVSASQTLLAIDETLDKHAKRLNNDPFAGP